MRRRQTSPPTAPRQASPPIRSVHCGERPRRGHGLALLTRRHYSLSSTTSKLLSTAAWAYQGIPLGQDGGAVAGGSIHALMCQSQHDPAIPDLHKEVFAERREILQHGLALDRADDLVGLALSR